MRRLYVCNTTGDKVDIINLDKFTLEESIGLPGVNFSKVGPHGLCIQGQNIYTSNCYDGSVTIVDIDTKTADSYYLGRYCRDICALGNHLYIICGDSNSTVIFDKIKKEILEIIPTGDSPHSIDCCTHNNKIVVANNGDNSITVFDSLYGNDIKNIKVGNSPNKALFTLNGDYIMVCESGSESFERGCVSVISSRTYNTIYKIPVGNCPFDMYCDQNFCYVTNYGDGTISIIDTKSFEVMSTIRVGGMPRGIVSDDGYIYIGDSYNSLIMKMNIKNEQEKIIIQLTGQPTGMIIA